MAGGGGGIYVSGPNIAVLPGWRIGLLLALFFVIASAYVFGVSWLEAYFKRTGKRGLRSVLVQLNTELLVLGLISLLLVSFEEYFLKICIPCSGSNCYWGCSVPNTTEAGSSQAVEVSESNEEAVTQSVTCVEVEEVCPAGSEPFWSSAAIIQAHILIFTIAVVHLFYAAFSMTLCIWCIRRWKKYEIQAKDDSEMAPLESRFIPKGTDNVFTHWMKCLVSTFTYRVNYPLYAALRRLFIERLDLERDFDFNSFLVESMEDSFAEILEMTLVLWGVLLFWIMVPFIAYARVWLTGVGLIIVIVVAVKMQDIITELALDAYKKYGNKSFAVLSGRGVSRGLVKLGSFPPVDYYDEYSDREEERTGAALQQEIIVSSADTVVVESEGNTGAAVVGSASFQRSSLNGPSKSMSLKAPAVGSVSRTRSHAVRFGSMRSVDDSDNDSVDEDEGSGEGSGDGQPTSLGMPRSLTSPPQSPFEGDSRVAQEDLESGDNAEKSNRVPSDNMGAQVSSWWSRSSLWCGSLLKSGGRAMCSRCPGWLQCAGIRKGQEKKKKKGGLAAPAFQRSYSFSTAYKGKDAATLFWFGKPKLVMHLVQFVYFENSLSIATVIFSAWQSLGFDYINGGGGWALLGPVLGVNVFVVLFLSIAALPIYALTTAAGSHTAATVIKLALKQNAIDLQTAEALHDTLMANRRSEGPPRSKQQGGETQVSADVDAIAAAENLVRTSAILSPNLARTSGQPSLQRPSKQASGDAAAVSRVVDSMYAKQITRYLERVSATSAGKDSAATQSLPAMGQRPGSTQQSPPRMEFKQLSTLLSMGGLDEPSEPGEFHE